MFRHFRTAAMALIVTAVSSTGAPAQMPNFQPIALTEANASAALGAVPDILTVARKYQDVGGELDALTGMATHSAAQTDLNSAAAANGFASYGDWVAVMQTIMVTYAYIQSGGALQQMAPAMNSAIQEILNNPNIPQAQKDQIIAQMNAANAAVGAQANAPSAENQAVVNSLTPQIEAVIQQMKAMQ